MMTIDLAKITIDKIANLLSESNENTCKITWHGGEPLLWGRNNYEKILSYMFETYPHINWINAMQTNLTLLSDDFLEVFQKYGVQFSTSMDGYEELHNQTRVTITGEGSYKMIADKLSYIKSKGMDIGLIVVLNSKNIDYLIDIYKFFKEHNQEFIVNPLYIEGEVKHNNDLSITSEQYADAVIKLFDYWIKDYDAVNIGTFTEWASSLKTMSPSVCTYCENCQNVFTVIEPNGNILACDRLCGNENYVFGNVIKDSLNEVYNRKRELFAKRTEILKNTECADCRYWNICYGGCPSDSIINKNNINTKFSYCEALKKIYNHIENTLSLIY